MKLEYPQLQSMVLESPVGRLRLLAHPLALVRIEFTDTDASETHQPPPVLELAAREMEEYFKGERIIFTIPVDPSGTHFQLNVWEELYRIQYGKTISYQDLAKKLGDVRVIRAAAGAIAKNPIPIVVPCHRVIGKYGSLTGYSGGLLKKKWLLEHEAQRSQNQLFR